MNHKFCVICGAMDTKSIFLPPNSFVIAADKGYKVLKDNGITPDIIIGDFDSASVPQCTQNIIKYPIKKDDTDTMLCVKYALEQGYQDIILYGCTGGNFGHQEANRQTLCYIANRGGRGYMLSENEAVTVIKNSAIDFPQDNQGRISVFSVCGDSTGVTIKGLNYQCDNITLSCDFPLGASNSFTGNPATVSVNQGMLEIVWDTTPKGFVDKIKTT